MESKDYSSLIPSDGLKAASKSSDLLKQALSNITLPKVDTDVYKTAVENSQRLDELFRSIDFKYPDIQLTPVEPDPLIRESQEAAIKTAENTAFIKDNLLEVLTNQNEHIKLQRLLLDNSNRQLEYLKHLFFSQEDSTAVIKEILQIIESEKIDIKQLTAEQLIELVLKSIGSFILSKGIITL